MVTLQSFTNDRFRFNYFNFFAKTFLQLSAISYLKLQEMGIIQRQIWMNLEKNVFLLFPNIHAKSLLYIQQ